MKTQQPEVVERVLLSEITGDDPDIQAISDIGYAVLSGLYDPLDLRKIVHEAAALSEASAVRFLSLNMLRGAHRKIPLVRELIFSAERLSLLSEIAHTSLEPYPVDVARSHINYYEANKPTIDFHSDGAAMVEIIPLDEVDDQAAATLIYKGQRDQGLAIRSSTTAPVQDGSNIVRIPHRFGTSILLQGRRLCHSGSITPRNRILLVIAMRSATEPWKDDNTIARLAMDYEVDDFLEQWITDELTQKFPAYRRRHEQD
jgi:hypothetical protein